MSDQKSDSISSKGRMSTQTVFLFHGSKAKFDRFDSTCIDKPVCGLGLFDGWFFTDNLWGAKALCKIPVSVVVEDCENGLTPTIYGCQSYGVSFNDSSRIQILERVPYNMLRSLTCLKGTKFKITNNINHYEGGLRTRLSAI